MKINTKSRPDCEAWNYLISCFDGEVKMQKSFHGVGSEFVASSISAYCRRDGNPSPNAHVWNPQTQEWEGNPHNKEIDLWYNIGVSAQEAVENIVGIRLPECRAKGTVYLDGQGEFTTSNLTESDMFIGDYSTPPFLGEATKYSPSQSTECYKLFSTLHGDGAASAGTGGGAGEGNEYQITQYMQFNFSPPIPTGIPGLLAALPDGCQVKSNYEQATTKRRVKYTYEKGELIQIEGVTVHRTTFTDEEKEEDTNFNFYACFGAGFFEDSDGKTYQKCRYAKLGDMDGLDVFQHLYSLRSTPAFMGIAAVDDYFASELLTAPTIDKIKETLLRFEQEYEVDFYYRPDVDRTFGYCKAGTRLEILNFGTFDISKVLFEVEYPASANRPIINPADYPRMD